ncbi:MAG TPA: sigma 54-interacting transcriptional regulator [Pyrinomonadaceae bacterium]|jgi:DNA-binding NtrC family response regulator
MNLEISLLHQIDNPKLNQSERVLLRCRLAQELEEAGNYEGATGALGDLWKGVGERPALAGLDEKTAAQVFLRVGSLTDRIGSARQIEGSQERAKDFLTESRERFYALKDIRGGSEAQIELAICYWREGAHDEARITLEETIKQLSDSENDLKALALVYLAAFEHSANRLNDALRVLNEAATLINEKTSHSLQGKFHNTLALVLKDLGASEKRSDYMDRALVEFTAASFHFEQAGHIRFNARVENNLGFLYLQLNRYHESQLHLERARRLFVSLKDQGSVAQVDETRARLLIAQGQIPEAERVVKSAVRTQEKSGEQALLAESLTTHGLALARLGEFDRARVALHRAIEVAALVGDNERAGVAALTILEELSDQLSNSEITTVYERAATLLSQSQDLNTLLRLLACSKLALTIGRLRKVEFNTSNFIYASSETATLLRNAHRVAESGGTVLITGETGTGKEILARMIHEWSGRGGAFVPVNCGALTETLAESQIFGHLKGSFTDAVTDHAGIVRQAAGGTLFLDEIAELSQGNQSKLLRLIEQGEIHTLGAPVPEQVDVRIIAATNHDLRQQIKQKKFRDDLFYRLQTFYLMIPPLRERPEDIPPLAEHFIKLIQATIGKRVVFTPEAIEAMKNLPLKGNARELRALIERTIIVASEGEVITAQAVEAVALRKTQGANFHQPWIDCSMWEEVRLYEAKLIKQALDMGGGSVVRAAELLGISHQSLSAMLNKRHKELLPATNQAGKRKRRVFRIS